MGHDIRVDGSKETIFFERLKFLLLSVAFFFVIGGYTVAKEIKDSVFVAIVGKTYIPYAKFLAMFILIPAIIVYSYLVDHMRRYHLLMLYSGMFAVLGLIFTYLLGHPTIGLSNTDTSPYRLFGWVIYFVGEGYTPFVVSVFWAFANSISSPKGAKRNYAFMVSASKLGGMLSAGTAWYLFSQNHAVVSGSLLDVAIHQKVLGISSAMLLFVPAVIYILKSVVPGKYLHGYEAVYQAQKGNKKETEGVFAGLKLLVKHPYVMGIFGMVYFYEVLATVLSYLRLSIAHDQSHNISQVTAVLFKSMFYVHVVGFIMSLFGTTILLRWLGERICLLLIPLLSGALLLYLMVVPTPSAVIVAWVGFKAINYAFAWPVRESLYIPTVKEIKFKSKSWIDAFGSKFAKSSGSTFNVFVSNLGSGLTLPVHSMFFAGVVSIWFLVALVLGGLFDKAIAQNKVIGMDEDS